MSAKIATIPSQHGLAQQPFISREKVELIKQTICKGATDTELELFVDVCNRTQLDPFARQIFAVPRWDSSLKKNTYAFQISIDGFRLIAERSGQYRGQTEPEFCGVDGNWKTIWLSDEPPFAARVGVFRAGFEQPLYAIAKFKNYAQTKQDGKLMAMWAKMPDHMIAKCAEALALRKAFPQDLSGLYTPEEAPDGEKLVRGQELTRQPLNPTTPAKKSREEMTGRERSIEDITNYVKTLREMEDEMFTGATKEERSAKVLLALHQFALDRDLKYETLNGVKELNDTDLDFFAGWLEGRIVELKEQALDPDGDDPLI